MLKAFLLAFLFQLVISSLPDEVAYHRNYFYVGGGYSDNGKGEHIFKGQMYVEHLTPVGGSRREYPMVFIHGQGQTGTNWLNKPDGGRGWASYFIHHGYECYIVDQTFRGRSSWHPGDATIDSMSAEQIQKFFTATRNYNIWPQAKLHTQWPGSGVMGDPVFDNYYASTVQFIVPQIEQESTMQAAGAALLDRIGRPVILMSHSQAGSLGWLIADARPNYIHSMVAIEPSGPPFENAIIYTGPARPYGIANVPVSYTPHVVDPEIDLVKQMIYSDDLEMNCTIQADDPPPRQLTNLSGMKMLIVTAESSYHRQTEWCTVIYLQQAGVPAVHLQLGDIGIHGNGHMMFLESNSDEIAKVLHKWIEK